MLFLRPTESLTVFLQQLGRGLRLSEDKECLTVLDFVGQAHRNFRFDLRYRALLTDPSVRVDEQVEHGFTHLPAGCTILMERVARQHVLENVRQALRQTRSTLVRELREVQAALGRLPTLGEFLERAGIEPDDLYRRDLSFTRLCVEAGLAVPLAEPDEAQLTRGLRRIAHIGDAEQIRCLAAWLDPSGARRPRAAARPGGRAAAVDDGPGPVGPRQAPRLGGRGARSSRRQPEAPRRAPRSCSGTGSA